jgi:hypothetical protein
MPGMRAEVFDPRLRAAADMAASGHDAVCHLDPGADAAGGREPFVPGSELVHSGAVARLISVDSARISFVSIGLLEHSQYFDRIEGGHYSHKSNTGDKKKQFNRTFTITHVLKLDITITPTL